MSHHQTVLWHGREETYVRKSGAWKDTPAFTVDLVLHIMRLRSGAQALDGPINSFLCTVITNCISNLGRPGVLHMSHS